MTETAPAVEGDAAVCVVVSTYNRSSLLPTLVAALRNQTCESFEAILVDNGSTDDTYEVLCRLTQDDARFRVMRVADNAGPGRARNKAWRAASAPLIAFTDDDCAPEPTWLDALLAAAATADIVQGRTIWSERPPAQKPRWFDRGQTIVEWSDRYETCNLLVPRAILEELNGFDVKFPIAMGEDTDLGLRAVAAGASTAFATDAVVRHHVWSMGLRDYLHQRRRYSEAVMLMKVNPAARSHLRWGFVLRGVHLLQWALVPATVVSIWAGMWWFAPAIIVLWAARNTYRTRGRPFSAPKRFLHSLVHFGAYGYETTCFALASIRYRSLVI